jgi:DNA-binding transcriptional ArsR family regulator
VYVGDHREGGVQVLALVPATSIIDVTYLGPPDADARLTGTHPAGAIVIRTRRMGPRPALRAASANSTGSLPGEPCAGPRSGITCNHMVVRRALSDAEIDRVFHALADATRRDIVARVLGGEPASISALAARYDMSFAAVQKHVAVLEGAGLVTKQTQGREKIVRGNPARIARARDLLARLEGLWRARYTQLDRVLSDSNLEK